MSHIRIKTTFNVEGSYGSVDKETLYIHHHNTCDVTTFFNKDGEYIFSFEDTMKGNLLDAMNRSMGWWDPEKNKLAEGLEYMNKEDSEKCNL